MPSSSGSMPPGSNVPGTFVAFTIRPDGNVVVPNPPTEATTATNAALLSEPSYFLTLLPVRYDTNSTLPQNYVLVQVNPDTASTKVFRP